MSRGIIQCMKPTDETPKTNGMEFNNVSVGTLEVVAQGFTGSYTPYCGLVSLSRFTKRLGTKAAAGKPPYGVSSKSFSFHVMTRIDKSGKVEQSIRFSSTLREKSSVSPRKFDTTDRWVLR